jgi:hypothetical protein
MNDNSPWHAPSSRGCAGSEVRNQAVFSFVPDWQCSIGSPKGHLALG